MDLSSSFRNCSGSAVEQPLPGEHLSDVCGFIPELATELATQDEEMEEKHQHLLHLKDELKKEHERLKCVVVSVCSANRAITVAQDRAAQSGLSCQQLEKSITSLTAEREDLQRQLERASREREREEKIRAEYRKKMAAHQEKVSHAEQGSSIHMQLAELQAKKQQLEGTRTSYMHGVGLKILSGERQKELHENIIAAETAGTLLDEEISKTRLRVKVGENQVETSRKEVEVCRDMHFQKRRQAQLTRLHRQLQEAQARRRQWGKQINTLQSAVSLLRQKLTDLS